MSKSILILAGAVVLAGIGVPPGKVYAEDPTDTDDKEGGRRLVCYTWDIFPNERFMLDVEKHSPLSENPEQSGSSSNGKLKQLAFSVHGKHVVQDFGMSAVNGTIVRAKDVGAHMGLHSIFIRGNGAFEFSRPVTVDCTTDEDTAVPTVWNCESRNEFDTYHGFSKLTKVDETQDPLCNCFQNGKFVCDGTEQGTAGRFPVGRASVFKE
jgi:hypothetical protein